MRMKNRKLILLIIIGILTFIIGMRYELDYRILTRRTVKYFADYELNFYGGKDFRIFETDIAFILTLFPIGFYFIIRKINSVKKILCLNLVYLILSVGFYSLFCYLESQFIKITATAPVMNDGIMAYHHNNVNYRMILIFTLISTFMSGIIIKRLTNKKTFVNNGKT